MAPHPTSTVFVPPSTVQVAPRAESTIPPEVLAYTSTFGFYSPWICPTGTYLAGDQYARCCPKSTNCPLYTTCVSGSIIANDQFRETCSGPGSRSVCVMGTIFESEGDTRPKTFPGCWPSWTGGDWEAIRTPPVANTSLTTTAVTITSVLSSASVALTSSATSSVLATSSKSASKILTAGELAAIIACSIIGMILLVGSFIFFYKRYTRRLKREEDARVAEELAPRQVEQIINKNPVEIGEHEGKEDHESDSSSGNELFLEAETSHDLDHFHEHQEHGASNEAEASNLQQRLGLPSPETRGERS